MADYKYQINWNRNRMAAISIQTTGPNFMEHGIIQICVLVLTSDLKPDRTILPFFTDMIPRSTSVDFKHMPMSKVDYYKVLQRDMDADRAADLFDEWYNKIGLSNGKKLIPLAYKWANVYPFLHRWLGFLHMEHYFQQEYRDVFPSASFENDKSDHNSLPYEYSNIFQFRTMCSRMKIEYTRPSNTMQDCACLAELYRRMLRNSPHLITTVDTDAVAVSDGEVPNL